MTLDSKHVVETLRRDATYVGQAAVAVVVLCFAGLALAAAIFDLNALRY
jgi:hypothetical protein